MARKKGRSRKGKSRRGKGKRKGSRSASKAIGSATEVGALLTVGRIAMWGDALPYLIKNPSVAGAKASFVAAKAGATRADTYIPVLAGMAIHWGKNKPVLKIVGKPLDRMSKKYLHRPL